MGNENSYIVRKDIVNDPLWKNGAPLLPVLDIELTERCNNNCIHCYINQPPDHRESLGREMSTARVIEILDEAATLGCLTVRLTGGEPLLRPDFAKIYLHARKKGIKVRLFTNATLINEELLALFDRYPPGEPIEITLYGMHQQSYESVSRVKGSFARAMKGVKQLATAGVPLMLKFIRLPGREDELDAFARFAQKYSADGEGGSITMDFTMRCRRDSSAKNQRIAEIRATPQEILTVLCRNVADYKKGQRQFARKFMHPGGVGLFDCGCGKSGSVDAYGKLQPCLLLRDPELVYDLKEGSIRDALERFFPEVLQKTANNPDYIERCAGCFLKGLCDQCPAWSWMENGSLDTPVEYLCDIAHEQARYLGLLKKGEKAWQVKDYQDRIDRFVNEENDRGKKMKS